MAKGKRLKKAYEGLSPDQAYALEEAVKLLKSRPAAKFDETVELAMNLNIDPRKADQRKGLVHQEGELQLDQGAGHQAGSHGPLGPDGVVGILEFGVAVPAMRRR